MLLKNGSGLVSLSWLHALFYYITRYFESIQSQGCSSILVSLVGSRPSFSATTLIFCSLHSSSAHWTARSRLQIWCVTTAHMVWPTTLRTVRMRSLKEETWMNSYKTNGETCIASIWFETISTHTITVHYNL